MTDLVGDVPSGELEDPAVVPILTALVSLADWIASSEQSLDAGRSQLGHVDTDTARFHTVRREWFESHIDEVLVDLAGELGLDETAFAACYDSRTALESVLSDQSELNRVIGSTPTFVILHADGPSVIEGAQPLEQFIAGFDGLLGE